MKKFIKISLLFGVLAVSLSSCKEDEIKPYNGPESINIVLTEGTTADMSFLTFGPEVVSYTFGLEAQLVGYASNAPRTVELAVIKTYIDGEEAPVPEGYYSMPSSAVIPAGGNKVSVPVVVNRADIGDEGVFTIEMAVVGNGDFVGSSKGTIDLSFTKEFPNTWYDSDVAGTNALSFAAYALGKCTKARYAYLYNHLGTIDVAPWSPNYGAAMNTHITKMNGEIIAYNSQFGSDESKWLKDDDGSNLYMGTKSPF